jgi:DNA-binding transcriptional MocR family regulator
MTSPVGGNVLWIQLAGGADGGAVYRRALERGIGILPGEIFSPRGRHRSFIRVSCGTPMTPEIAGALVTLGQLAREGGRQAGGAPSAKR